MTVDITVDIEQEMSRFQASCRRLDAQRTAARDVQAWLERDGGDPPECIRVRMLLHNLDAPSYYHLYTQWKTQNDAEFWNELQAIEDWAIRLVDPNWRR